MAMFKHKSDDQTLPFAEQRKSGHIVAFTSDIVAEPVPSPAHALQQMLIDRAADGFITDSAERQRSLTRFVGTAVLLWGGAGATLVTLMAMTSR